MHRAVLAAAIVAALAAAGSAAAHPSLSPSSIEAGQAEQVVAQVPNERPGRVTTAVTLTFPTGFSVVEATGTAGWSGSSTGAEAHWTGGRIDGVVTVDFPVSVKALVPAGSYPVRLDQGYDDGKSVRTWTQVLVLPAVGANAPKQNLVPAIIAGVAGLLVVVGSLVALRVLRRRPEPKDET